MGVLGKAKSLLRGDRAGVPRFEYWGKPLGAADYQAHAARAGWRPDVLVNGEVALRGLVRPARAGAPWLLFYSGNSDQYFEEARRLLDPIAASGDYGVATWAYRGFDGSTGRPERDAIVADAHRIYEHCLGVAGVAPSRVHLAGFSLGSYLAAAVGARAGSGAKRPASVMLLSPCTQMDVGQPSMVGRFSAADHYDTMPFLPSIAAPMLVAHGDRDAALPVEMGRAVAKALGARARYVEVPGVGHADLLLAQATHDAVRAMLEHG